MPSLITISKVISLSAILANSPALAKDAYPTATGDLVGVLDVFQDCETCPEMIVLPMGQFQMGSTQAEVDAARNRFFENQNINPVSESRMATFSNEMPKHDVFVDRPIAMGRNEITRAEWAACVEDGGCEQGLSDIPRWEWIRCIEASNCVLTPDDRVRFRLPNGPHATDPRSPMTGITYHEMTGYTDWLNDKIGANKYRLPTEAEWEYAARAGTTTTFAQGDTLTLELANYLIYRREIRDGEYEWDYDLGSVREMLPVDRLDAANGWGLRHMSGNASEFTFTCGEGPHRGLASTSAYLVVDLERASCRRSLKGGSYTTNVELTRPARRVAISDDHWSPSLGFRVVRDLTHDLGPAE